jgi:hypothetical protein
VIGYGFWRPVAPGSGEDAAGQGDVAGFDGDVSEAVKASTIGSSE